MLEIMPLISSYTALYPMKAKSILVVEDDAGWRDRVCIELQKHGFKTIPAANGYQAIELFENLHPDLVLLDIGLPDIDGDEVCRHIRKTNQTVPIVFLTGMDDEGSQIRGYELGSVNTSYLTKPVSKKVVVALVKNVLAEVGSNSQYGRLRLDDDSKRVYWDEDEVHHLTPAEFDILKTMLSQPEKVWSPQELNPRIVKATIQGHKKNIKRKFEEQGHPDPIKTVFGHGYRLAP